jgi:hypothetical protein
MKTLSSMLAVAFVGLLLAAPARAEQRREHPYLFFSDEDVPHLKARLEQPELEWLWANVERNAGSATRQRQGWSRSIMCSGLAWQLTGERRYADAGIETMLHIAAIPGPWSPSRNFLKYCDLDTARKTLPLGLGYDLLYDAMTEQQRETIRESLRKNAFAPYLKALARFDEEDGRFEDEEGHWEWWSTAYFNWNAWINGDLGLAGLATLGDIPEAREVVEKARAALKFMHPEFDQGAEESGGWDEGPMYWGTSVSHPTRFYAALERVLGTDDGFFELPGMAKTMWYAIDFTAPDGHWVSFQDCSNRLVLDPPSVLYYLAKRYNEPQFARHLDVNAASWHPMPYGIIWRPAIETPPAPERPAAAWYRDVDWAVLRSGELFLPFKAGDMGANHQQHDANNLLLWVRGERMLNDPGYGHRTTEMHNCVLVDGHGHHNAGGRRPGVQTETYADILACGTVGGAPYLVADAAPCYEVPVTRAQRHAVLTREGFVIVLDDLLVPEPAEFTANWHTLHELAEGPGHSAVMQGEELALHVVQAADGPLEATIADGRHDRVWRVQSAAQSRAWRLFTVLAPDESPEVAAYFGEERVVVNVNGTEYPFEPTPEGGLRYAGGEYVEAPPIGE